MADTKIKLCGLTRPEDIEVANRLMPDYIGFVFARKSRRYVEPEQAAKLRAMLDPSIQVVGVFVNEELETVAELINRGIIQVAQLHGKEDAEYVLALREMISEKKLNSDEKLISQETLKSKENPNSNKKQVPNETMIFQAFRVDTKEDVERAGESLADYILLDSGEGGTGTTFNWELIQDVGRPYFLAGGLNVENVAEAVARLQPYGVDVSSGIETDKRKDSTKMKMFVESVKGVRL